MNDKVKKILNVSLKVITVLVVAFSIFVMIFTIISVTTVDKNDRNLLGTRFYIVKTDSMSPSENNENLKAREKFRAGDIVLIRRVKDHSKLEAGDIIAFMSLNTDEGKDSLHGHYGQTITHMIREVKKTDDGKILGYVTYGTNTGTDDEVLVEPEYVLGKYTGKLPKLGYFFAFVKSTPGYILCILIPFLLLIIYNGINVIRLFRKYKGEQMEVMEAEKAKIAEDRAKNEEMMRQLLALKAELDLKAQADPLSVGSADAPEPENTPVEAEKTAEAEEPAVAEDFAVAEEPVEIKEIPTVSDDESENI